MARRAEPQSFEDRNFFPSFHECPDEHEWDDRYYQDADPGNSDSAGHYRKHWCLLGEIIHTENFIRPRIVAKDNKGEEFVVAFYPDNPDDMPRILKNFKVGNTIAIMYALTHMFLDMTTGVRVEDTDDVLVCIYLAYWLRLLTLDADKASLTDHPSQHEGRDRDEQGSHKVHAYRRFSAKVPCL